MNARSLAPKPAAAEGVVLSVRGAVVDVAFAAAQAPGINTAMIVKWDRPETLVLEVHSYVDPLTVRGIALQATEGLARGVKVEATGAPVSVPVGDAILGRLLDVLGTLRDNGPALAPDTPRRAIHAAPPALADKTSSVAMFETGVKVIDLLAPMAQGGKAAMFGGASRSITLTPVSNIATDEVLSASAGKSLAHLEVRAAPFALLMNTRKTERGAGKFLAHLAVRTAPFALLRETWLAGSSDSEPLWPLNHLHAIAGRINRDAYDDASVAVVIARHDQRAKAETPAALDHLGAAIDKHHFFSGLAARGDAALAGVAITVSTAPVAVLVTWRHKGLGNDLSEFRLA